MEKSCRGVMNLARHRKLTAVRYLRSHCQKPKTARIELVTARINELIRLLWRRAKLAYQRRHFHTVTSRLLDTPPYTCRDDGALIVSLVGHSQIIMYLAAAKSFLHRLGRGSVLAVNDGTLVPADLELIRKHLIGIEIVDAKTINSPGLPVGGCWERLILLADRAKDKYVIQLDSDTLTIAPIPEIQHQVANNLPFMLRGEAEAEIRPLSEAPLDPFPHVVNVLEGLLRNHPQQNSRAYARGCAAFAGFPRGAPIQQLLAEFGEWQRHAIGQRMFEWGTEQVASNYILSNLDGVQLLPYERYMNHWGQPLGEDVRLAHFIGTYRFDKGRYRSHVEDVARTLKEPAA